MVRHLLCKYEFFIYPHNRSQPGKQQNSTAKELMNGKIERSNRPASSWEKKAAESESELKIAINFIQKSMLRYYVTMNVSHNNVNRSFGRAVTRSPLEREL